MLARGLFAAGATAAGNLSVFDPASPPADSIRGLFYFVLALCGVIFILVEGMLIYCIVRFRRRPADGAAEPPQLYGSQPIETAWTVAPLLTVFVLFLVVTRTIYEVKQVPGAERDPLAVTVVGHQWWWEYRYPDFKIVTANELHVPAGVPVVLTLESVDVIHSFWVPRLAGKMDVIPGKTNQLWFEAQAAGVYHGQCAEYCGTQHANMLLIVVADSPADFERWKKNQQAPARPAEPARAGRELFLGNACVNCHTVRGTPARGTFGPDLTHLMSRQTLAAGMLANDDAQLTDWVQNPQAIKPGCLMPDMHMEPGEVAKLVKYLQTLE